MLHLKLATGATIPLQRLRITMRNPVLDPASTRRTFSYPATVAASSEIRAALGYPDRLDIDVVGRRYAGVELWIMGQPFERGVLRITGATDRVIEVVFQSDDFNILEELALVKINQILGSVIPQLSQPNAHWVFDIGTIPGTHQLDIDGNTYTYNSSGGETAADVVDALSALINADFPGMTFDFPGQTQLKLEASQVNDHPVDLGSLNDLTLNSVTTVAEAELAAFQNYIDNLNAGTPTEICFPTIQWFSFYEGNNTEFGSRINFWLDGTFLDNESTTEENRWLTTWVPFVFVSYILDRIAANIDDLSGFAGSFLETDDFNDLIVFNNVALDFVQEDLYEDGVVKKLNRFVSEIYYNDHVPDLTAREFFLNLVDGLALWYEYVDSQIVVHKKKDQVNQPPIDWTHKADPSFSVEFSTLDGFTIDYADNNDFFSSAGQLDPYTSGQGELQLELPFSSVHRGLFTSPVDDSILLGPVINQKGNSRADILASSDYAFRLLLYRGLQPDFDNGLDYPMATNNSTNAAGASVGDLELNIDGAKGLYQQLFEDYIELLTAPIVTKVMHLSISDLIELRNWKNAKRIIRHEQGQMTGVIREVQFEVDSRRGLSLSTVEFVQVKK